MISAQEALKLALSEDLSTDERVIYNKIINHIDKEIKSNFNGVSISIRIDGSYVMGQFMNLSEVLPKEWRRKVVLGKILREYQENGWKIEEKNIPGTTRKQYLFSIDPSSTRDEKIKKILDDSK
jgi:hypothetical protein